MRPGMAAKASLGFPGLQQRLENGLRGEKRIRQSVLEFSEDKCVALDYVQKKVELPSSVRSTFLMVFSPDGGRVGSTHGDHKIYISDIKTGKVSQTLEGHPRTPWCLAFHPTLQNILASGCLAGEVRVWDLKSGACEVWVNGHGSVIASLAFHPIDHVILIATYNELHFWDWRQSHAPFLTLTTPSEKEKVRFVKFDPLGTKIVTGISNIPPLRSSNHALHSGHPFLGSAPRTSDPASDTELSGAIGAAHPSNQNSLALRRSNLLSRVMSMYRQLEGLEESRATSVQTSLEPSSSSSPTEIDDLGRILETSSVAERVLERLRSVSQMEVRTTLEPLSPAAESRLEQAREYIATVNHRVPGSAPFSSLLTPPPSATTSFPPSPFSDNATLGSSPSNGTSNSSGTSISNSTPGNGPGAAGSFDYSTNLMNTFRRLHSLCTRLAQLMQDQQSPTSGGSGIGLSSTSDASTSLSDLLSRLQQSLQNMSTAALTTAIAQEHIQQVRQRVSEILERLVNVSGYRARLSNLRDQIYEVAERIAAGSEPEYGPQRWDLIHCLWLVDMSIHLTRQMQRILAADYRLTQLTLNSSASINGRNGNSQATGTSDRERSSQTLTSAAERQLLEEADAPSPEPELNSLSALGRTRLRLARRMASSDHETSSRSVSSNNSSANISNISVTISSLIGGSSGSSILDPVPSTSSGIVRTRFHPYTRWMIRSRSTGAHSLESRPGFTIPSVRVSGPDDMAIDESVERPDEGRRERPRSPPLPEIHQSVLNSSSSSGSERFNVFVPPSPRQPSQHIWFSGGVGWPMSGPIGSEMGFLGSGANLSYRIQCWNFSRLELPNLKDAQANLVVHKVRIHNDASLDVCSKGQLLACLVPVDSSHSVNLCIYSLDKETFAQCLYVWTFGGNAISVSLSPLSRYIVVGLTSPRNAHVYSYPPSNELATVGQVFKLSGHLKSSPPSFEHVRNIDVSRGDDIFSLNSIRWLPGSGEGLIYGTNRGHLVICRPNCKEDNKSFSRHSTTTGTQTYPTTATAGTTLSIGTQTNESQPLVNVDNSSDSD